MQNNKLHFDPEKHIYTYDGAVLPSVTGILESEGYIDSRFFTEAARIRGTYVHKACELDDLNDLDIEALDPALLPYLTAWREARKALGIPKFNPENIERRIVSLRYRYAGTLDRLYLDLLADIKSGAKSPTYSLQTAGYKIGHEEMTGEKIKRRVSVYLHEDGTFEIDPHKDATDETIFLCATKQHHWKLAHKIGGSN
jgi:hypothetical protein